MRRVRKVAGWSWGKKKFGMRWDAPTKAGFELAVGEASINQETRNSKIKAPRMGEKVNRKQ